MNELLMMRIELEKQRMSKYCTINIWRRKEMR